MWLRTIKRRGERPQKDPKFHLYLPQPSPRSPPPSPASQPVLNALKTAATHLNPPPRTASRHLEAEHHGIFNPVRLRVGTGERLACALRPLFAAFLPTRAAASPAHPLAHLPRRSFHPAKLIAKKAEKQELSDEDIAAFITVSRRSFLPASPCPRASRSPQALPLLRRKLRLCVRRAVTRF